MTVADVARQLQRIRREGTDCVLLTVVRTAGSTPRDAGANMIVSATDQFGTIGGGRLEYEAVERGRAMLAGSGPAADVAEFTLGPELTQCCGGVALVLFETIPAHSRQQWIDEAVDPDTLSQHRAISTVFERATSTSRKTVKPVATEALPSLLEDESGITFLTALQRPAMNVVVFGAGHVGTALVSVLSGCDCWVTWVDSRAELLPEHPPANVVPVVVDDEYREAAALVDAAPAGSYFIVLTHSHPLDFLLCKTVLESGNYRYLGLIGSKTKREKFRARLREAGLTDAAVASLVCPIGLAGIPGKIPGEIAVAVAADLLQREAAVADSTDRSDRPVHVPVAVASSGRSS